MTFLQLVVLSTIMKRKNIIFAIGALLLFLTGYSSAYALGGYPDIEIIESTPVGTTLDNPDIRDAKDVWIEMIKNAKKRIDIAQFYVANDTKHLVLQHVVDELKKAGKRGVHIRFLIDSKFYSTYPDDADKLRLIKNLTLKTIDYGKLAGGVMHAKYFIIDDKTVYFGSQNFDWRSLTQIHELGLLVKNKKFASMVKDVFNTDWEIASGMSKFKALKRKKYWIPITVGEKNEDVQITPVFAPKKVIPDRRLSNEKNILKLIKDAHSRIEVQVMTFSPVGYSGEFYFRLFEALMEAANKGVNVRLIVTDWSVGHPAIDYLKSMSILPNIDVKISSIPLAPEGFIPYARVEHCKYMVVDDDKAWIGSSNWTKDYFYSSRNVGAVVKGKKMNQDLHRIFQKSWDSPYTEFVDINKSYSVPKKH